MMHAAEAFDARQYSAHLLSFTSRLQISAGLWGSDPWRTDHSDLSIGQARRDTVLPADDRLKAFQSGLYAYIVSRRYAQPFAGLWSSVGLCVRHDLASGRITGIGKVKNEQF